MTCTNILTEISSSDMVKTYLDSFRNDIAQLKVMYDKYKVATRYNKVPKSLDDPPEWFEYEEQFNKTMSQYSIAELLIYAALTMTNEQLEQSINEEYGEHPKHWIEGSLIEEFF